MTRPSRDETLMDMAFVMSKRSSCSRNHVGVVIARDGRILSTGYNGAPAGLAHCNHDCDCLRSKLDVLPADFVHGFSCNATQPCRVAIHAEANAVAYAARHGVNLEGGHLYTTLSPCVPCAQLIVAAGITTVTYAMGYRDMSGVEYLQNAAIDNSRLER